MNRPRTFGLPESYDRRIRATLEALGFSVEKPRALAEAVLRLSEHYHAHPDSQTPWHEKWAQAASIAYFFPLNLARNRAVAREASRLGFFDGLSYLIDFGSGTGSALAAFSEARAELIAQACDISAPVIELGRQLTGRDAYETWVNASVDQAPDQAPPGFSKTAAHALVVASYVLTELEELPAWWRQAEALAIIEPSTQGDGRRLMAARSKLIEQGYSIWAPCTHQGECPLLTKSERDWCHDRIRWEAPAWFMELEKRLPMKNRTITYSYLLARRSLHPPKGLNLLGRLTGDMLVEKGKTRQSFCRGPEREFLAWFPQRFPKGSTPLELERGRLIRTHGELEKKSSELRVQSPNQIEDIPDDAEIGRRGLFREFL